MKKLIVANWKMNGNSDKVTADLNAYLQNPTTNHENVVLSLPFVYLAKAKELTANGKIRVAAQNVSSYEPSGAYTGEISGGMLEDLRIDYVLIGHSERRDYFAETDEVLLKKLDNALAHKVAPIFCFGESLNVRQSGDYLQFISDQLALLAKLAIKPEYLVLAYEPIWAIGTGLTATVEQVKEAVEYSAKVAMEYLPDSNLTLLYGGSVSAQNAKDILGLDAVDGVLVGGASLKVPDFTTICEAGK